MTFSKRLFDVVGALGLMLALSPFFILTGLLILTMDGRPIFYVSERVRTPGRVFNLIKFRTMSVASTKDSGVSGADKKDRITRLGKVLRATRLDETPQLWNVLRGHMSFVGPRPPLREYVERYPEIYRRVLKDRPGITGMASLYFHKHEEKLLSRCSTRSETDDVYSRRCIPRKARLDLIYQDNYSIWLDISILVRTIISKLPCPRRSRWFGSS